jgi:hypothetical protein
MFMNSAKFGRRWLSSILSQERECFVEIKGDFHNLFNLADLDQ